MRAAARVCCAMLATGGVLMTCAEAQSGGLPPYVPSRQVEGVIRVAGSPQMGELLRLYESGFRRQQPSVRFEDKLQSTMTAVSSVGDGSADVGMLGREIWPEEIKAFAIAQGHAPMVVDVATGSYDVPKATFALMILVPRSNPLRNLSMAQLARVFGREREGAEGTIRTWGQLGLRGEWAERPVHLYGFRRDNDKARIFSQLVFRDGEEWRDELHEFANEGEKDAGERIARAVAEDPDAIGISNVHYMGPGARALALAVGDGAAVSPSREHVVDRSYPLTRAVYAVLNAAPNHPPSDAVVEFLRFVLSREGQEAVAQEGNYLPLTSAVADIERRKVERISFGR